MNDVQALQRAIHDLTDQIQSPVLLTRLARYLYVNCPQTCSASLNSILNRNGAEFEEKVLTYAICLDRAYHRQDGDASRYREELEHAFHG